MFLSRETVMILVAVTCCDCDWSWPGSGVHRTRPPGLCQNNISSVTGHQSTCEHMKSHQHLFITCCIFKTLSSQSVAACRTGTLLWDFFSFTFSNCDFHEVLDVKTWVALCSVRPRVCVSASSPSCSQYKLAAAAPCFTSDNVNLITPTELLTLCRSTAATTREAQFKAH